MVKVLYLVFGNVLIVYPVWGVRGTWGCTVVFMTCVYAGLASYVIRPGTFVHANRARYDLLRVRQTVHCVFRTLYGGRRARV